MSRSWGVEGGNGREQSSSPVVADRILHRAEQGDEVGDHPLHCPHVAVEVRPRIGRIDPDWRIAQRTGIDGDAEECAANAVFALATLHHGFEHIIAFYDETALPLPSGYGFVIELECPESFVPSRLDAKVAEDRIQGGHVDVRSVDIDPRAVFRAQLQIRRNEVGPCQKPDQIRLTGYIAAGGHQYIFPVTSRI